MDIFIIPQRPLLPIFQASKRILLTILQLQIRCFVLKMEKDLKIVIAGAGTFLFLDLQVRIDSKSGMGGLACALALAKQGFIHIDVYETASNLGFVGAGIQLAPNMAKILDRLGVWADIEREAVVLSETSIRGKYLQTFKTIRLRNGNRRER